MDAGGSPLPDTINPNNFPAKLWRLVNNPAYRAICWDIHGETVIIDQQLFEHQVLSPSSITLDSPDTFKTTNFSSFIRQLNLYGFRKVDPPGKDNRRSSGEGLTFHQYSNPNFKRNQPELLGSLRRLTVDNKAKMQAGIDVNCRGRRLCRSGDGKDKVMKRCSSSLHSHAHQESTPSFSSKKAMDMTAHKGTPVPPRYLMRGHGSAPSPTVFPTDRGIPLSLRQHYAGMASSSNTVHIQQGLLAHTNHVNPDFTTFNHPMARFQPGFYSPVCQCYQQNLVAAQLTNSGLQTGQFSAHSYYQATFPVNMSKGDHSQVPVKTENQDRKKYEINLDTIFQIADEVMQTPPNGCLVRAVTPEKQSPVLVNLPNNCDISPAKSMQANPFADRSIIMAVQGNASVVTFKEEESVLSIPEQMPEDVICEVTGGDAKDSEVIDASNTPGDASQAHNSSCTGYTPDI